MTLHQRNYRWAQVPIPDSETFSHRARHTSCYTGPEIYIAGGNAESSSTSSDVWCLSLETGKRSWCRIECMGDAPPPLGDSASVILEGSLWIFGGVDRTLGSTSRDLYSLDLQGRRWSLMRPRGDVPAARNSHSMTVCRGNAFVFGGWEGSRFFDDMYVLHSRGSAWSQVILTTQDKPRARMGHSAVAYRSSIFILGGFNSPHTLDDLWEFNIACSRWNQCVVSGEGPSHRYRHSMVCVADLLVVFGGINAEKQRFNDCFLFHIGKQIWTQLLLEPSAIPAPRSFHQAAVVDGSMYIFGGQSDGKRLNDTYCLATPYSSGNIWAPMQKRRGRLPTHDPVGHDAVPTVERPPDEKEVALHAEIARLKARIKALEQRLECRVCFAQEINCYLHPCKHRCLCIDCATQIVGHGDGVCPICRVPILQLVQTFDA